MHSNASNGNTKTHHKFTYIVVFLKLVEECTEGVVFSFNLAVVGGTLLYGIVFFSQSTSLKNTTVRLNNFFCVFMLSLGVFEWISEVCWHPISPLMNRGFIPKHIETIIPLISTLFQYNLITITSWKYIALAFQCNNIIL